MLFSINISNIKDILENMKAIELAMKRYKEGVDNIKNSIRSQYREV